MIKNERTPNVKCKYSGCTNGTDKHSKELNNGQENGPKWSYVCLSCKRTNKWETIACCDEHREAYQQEVLASRAANKPVEDNPMKPIMSDMTNAEYDELMAKPVEQVEEETKAELAGYEDVIAESGFAGAVEAINAELDAESEAVEDDSLAPTFGWNNSSNSNKKNRKNKSKS